MKRRSGRLVAWPVIVLLTGAWNPLLRENKQAAGAAKSLRKGQAARAVKLYRKAMRALGQRPELQYDLGVALAAAGKDEDAEKAYLAASTRGDRELRIRARYNLGNLYFRMADRKAGEATKALTGAFAVLKKLGEVPDKPTKAQCEQFGKAVQAYKTAAGLYSAAEALDRKAFFEYKEVLLRRPEHFKAKWNLELALRGVEQAKSVESQSKRIEEEYARKCNKEKKNDKDKKNQDQKKQNQKNKDNKQPKDQDKKKQSKPEPKKGQKQQEQHKQQKQNQPKRQQERDRRKQVEKQLDRFERMQRKLQRRRMGSGVRRRVVKDW